MSLIRGFSDRVLVALLATAFVAMAIGVGALWWVRHRDDAHLEVLHAARDTALVQQGAARSNEARADTVLVHDTVEVRRTITQYVAAKVRTDTVVVTARGDSVRVDTLRAVVALTTRADSVVRACSVVVTSCAERVAAAEQHRLADSAVAATTLAVVRADAARAAHAASSRGWRRGLVLGAVATVGALVGLHQIARIP